MSQTSRVSLLFARSRQIVARNKSTFVYETDKTTAQRWIANKTLKQQQLQKFWSVIFIKLFCIFVVNLKIDFWLFIIRKLENNRLTRAFRCGGSRRVTRSWPRSRSPAQLPALSSPWPVCSSSRKANCKTILITKTQK